MTTHRNLTLASLIATVSLSALTVTGAFAQTPARPGPPAATQAAPDRAAMEQRMAARRAERARDMSTVLRLTPAQQPALNAFMASQTPPARDMANRMRNRQDRTAMTTPQRLEERAKRVEERRAFATRRTEAVRTFYAALSAEQKQVFDAMNRLRGPDGRGRGGQGMGRGGDHDGKGMRGPGGREGRGDRGGRGDRRGPGAPPAAAPAR